MPTKTETIEKVYFGPDDFGSLKQVTKDAQAIDKTITYEDVTEWKSKQTFGQKGQSVPLSQPSEVTLPF